MFNNMKNKIREKTGNDLSKFAPSSAGFGKSRSNQHSRQSSQGSITSITSDQSNKDDGDAKLCANNVIGNQDSSKTIENVNKSVDWENKLHEKEKEWREKEKVYVNDLLKQTKELQEALALVEENRKKYVCCQEEKEQLELYQKQELTQLKQLLLAKEEENNTNEGALKDALGLIESLKQEVNRLTPLEGQISNYQTKSRKDEEDAGKYEKLTTKVEMLSKENGALRMANEESRRILDESLSEEKAKNSELHLEIARLKKYLEELATALEEEKRVKDQTLLRNAEISQMTQLAQQELKQQQSQNEELFKKMSVLEEQLKQAQKDMKKFQSDKSIDNTDKLNERVQELENEVSDKNNSIRILQQNLADVKKSFQSELNDSIQANKMNNNCAQLEDINFKYMKHVLIKFLTSSEYEAQQLTKAVATLLKLNSDEERLIKETLEWRSSWFRSKPRIKLLSNPS